MRRMVVFFDCQACGVRCWVEAKWMMSDPESVVDLIDASFGLRDKGHEIHVCSEVEEDA